MKSHEIFLETGSVIANRYLVGRKLDRHTMGGLWGGSDEGAACNVTATRDVTLSTIDIFSNIEDGKFIEQCGGPEIPRLIHPHIPRVLDLYIEINAGIAIQILEPLQGSTLHTLRKSLGPGEFPLEFASTVLKQICDALMFVHHRGIYHEALEPSNIWLMDNKTVKVLNFGLTRSLDCVGALSLSYASIQQYDREDPTEANDVYGLGCLAYYLYAGEHPFGGQGSPTAAKNNLKAPVVSRLSAGKNKILERSVAFDRADRIPDVVTFSRDFFDA